MRAFPSCFFGLLCVIACSASAGEADQQVRLRLFAPAWRNIGNQRPQEVARRFTVIYGHLAPGPFHEGNPDCKCIKYSLGPYTVKYFLDRLPGEVFARDADGKVIKARDFANWLVVPDNPRWLEHITAEVRRLMASEFDGLFVDSLGTAPVETNYLLGKPINPHSGRLYTKREWLAAESVMVKAIRAAVPKGKLVTMNGLGPGTRYWAEPVEESPRVLLEHFDGAMSESIWRMAPAPLDAWPSPERWMMDIRMIQDVERRGLMGFWWTKCWTGGNSSLDQPDGPKLTAQWRRFALASYLLAAGPRSYFNFDDCKNDQNAAQPFPEYEAPLGAAPGPMQEIGASGAYARKFSGGWVLVNPTAGPITVPAPAGSAAGAAARFQSWGEDREVQFPLEIAPHTGLILTAATRSEPAVPAR